MRKDKALARELRLQGKSYGEICRMLKIKSKGTLSAWFRDLKLTDAAKMRLQRNQDLARKRGLLNFNHQRSKRVQSENKKALFGGAQMIGKLTQRERMLCAAALYWGEGTKSEGNGRSLAAVLTNTDPFMIQFYLRFVREYLNVREEKIRAQVILHDTASPNAAKVYWQKITKINSQAISITIRVSTASKRVRPKNILPYGTLQIRIHDRCLFYKMKGMINGLMQSTGL